MNIPFNTLLKRAVLNDDNGPRLERMTVSTITTAGPATLTAAQILGGYINRDPNGSNRTDTLPTAALLVAAIRQQASEIGVQLAGVISFEFVITNTADAAETLTIDAGSGGSNASGHTRTIAQNNSKRFSVHITNTTPGSEAYTLRSLGGYTT